MAAVVRVAVVSCLRKKRAHFVIRVPSYFAVVDEEMGEWIVLINANLLCLTSVTPENYRIKFMQWVTIFIKFNAVVQERKI